MKTNKKILAIGAWGQDDPEILTVDINPVLEPDVVHNLNAFPWPFEDGQFEKIICHHIIEHLNDIVPVMRELHRMCAAHGEVYIEVPHHTSYNARSLHHKMFFTYFSLDEFLSGADAGTWHTGRAQFKLLERKVTFHRAFRRYLLHLLFNKCPRIYERFWAFMIPAENIVFRLQPVKEQGVR